MATIEEQDIAQLVSQISELKSSIENKGNEGRTKLAAIPVDAACNDVRETTGKYKANSWAGFDPTKRADIHQSLLQIRDSLYLVLEQEGPREPSHIMFFEYASNTFIVLWALTGLLLITLLLGHIRDRWDQATNLDYQAMINAAWKSLDEFAKSEDRFNQARSEADSKNLEADKKENAATRDALKKASNDLLRAGEIERGKAFGSAKEQILKLKTHHGGATEQSVIEMVALLGALGGSIHFLGSIVMYIGNRKLRRSWLLYYLSLPFVGAAMAPIVYMLLRVGILTPTGQADGGTTISNLNLIAIYAFSALTGMFAKTATEKLGDVFAAIFQPKPDRTTGDKITSVKDSPPSGTGSGKGP